MSLVRTLAGVWQWSSSQASDLGANSCWPLTASSAHAGCHPPSRRSRSPPERRRWRLTPAETGRHSALARAGTAVVSISAVRRRAGAPMMLMCDGAGADGGGRAGVSFAALEPAQALLRARPLGVQAPGDCLWCRGAAAGPACQLKQSPPYRPQNQPVAHTRSRSNPLLPPLQQTTTTSTEIPTTRPILSLRIRVRSHPPPPAQPSPALRPSAALAVAENRKLTTPASACSSDPPAPSSSRPIDIITPGKPLYTTRRLPEAPASTLSPFLLTSARNVDGRSAAHGLRALPEPVF